MDNPATILNPVIKQIAEHFEFHICFVEDGSDSMWTITGPVDDRWDGPSFYWTSRDSFENFLNEMKQYFVDSGYPSNR